MEEKERPIEVNTLVLIKQDGKPEFRMVMDDPKGKDYTSLYDPLLKRSRLIHPSRITVICKTLGPYDRDIKEILGEHWEKVVDTLAIEILKLKG